MDKKELDEDAIGAVVDSRLRESLSWYNSKLATEREKVIRYYNGEEPKRQSSGNSSFVSTDVYDAVEMMKAQLLETFAAGYEIIRFDPQNSQDVEPSRIATSYTDYVLFRQNDGYKVFHDVIHDGLTARAGIVKVYWDTKSRIEDVEVEGLDQAEAEGLIVADEVETMNLEAQDDGTFKGKITKKIDEGQVRIDVVPPEEFFIEPQAKCLEPGVFCGHRTVKTFADLVAEGYDPDKLRLYNYESDSTLNQLPEVLARFEQMDNGFKTNEEAAQDELRPILVHEVYMKLQTKEDKSPKLYKIVRCGNQTLDMEEVEDLPFVIFVPLPVPHSFYGNNFAKLVMPFQNATTVLMRGILDHTSITNNPRYLVMKGGLTNPRELLDNRLGGLVNTTRPDAVMPLPQASLNPFVYQTIEMLKGSREETTGISSLSQGLNKDAISKQNSAAMVENLVSLSQTRQKIIARNFANNFLVPLFIKVYNTVLAKEQKSNIVELAGNWVEVDPRMWKERKSATVGMHLGYGEQDREAQKYMEMLALGSQDPDIAAMITKENKYNIASTVLKLRNIKDVPRYITEPSKVPPTPPDPMLLKKIELEERQVAAGETAAQAQAQKVAVSGEIDKLKLQLESMDQQIKHMLAMRDADRKDADVANKIDVSQRETLLAEQAPAEQQNTIISPNG